MTSGPVKFRVPPRLDMDAYADFVESSIREQNRDLSARQKKIEKRISRRFRISRDEQSELIPSRNTKETTSLQ